MIETREGADSAILDEHSLLLWQTCAYAEDLSDAAGSGGRLTPAFDAMLGFLHYRLLPYLSDEEATLPPAELRDENMSRLLLADHRRLRADVENVEASRTRQLLTLATEALVDRLDRHVRREERWIGDPVTRTPSAADREGGAQWALPLVLLDDVDLDALPDAHRDALVLERLRRMRRGETLHLSATHDLHPLWRRQRARDAGSYTWVYELDGPTRWLVRVTRRDWDGF